MYPDDKETWERVDTNEIIVKGATNNWQVFLEGLQDTLGLGIKLGFDTVKLLLDYLKSKADLVDSKLNKTDGQALNSLKVYGAGATFNVHDSVNDKATWIISENESALQSDFEDFYFGVDDGAGNPVNVLRLNQ